MLKFDALWHPEVSVEQLARIDIEGRESRKLILGTHTGTHVDAPLHFIENGRSIDEIPLEKLMGKVNIVNFSNLKKDEIITKEMLKSETITKRMIFKFDWGKYWGDKNFYKHYPHFSKEAAEFLISKGIELLGYDTPSPDDSTIKLGSERDSEIHKLFLGKNIVLVEYLANLEKVTDFYGWNICVNPLKIKGGDGSPARVYLFK